MFYSTRMFEDIKIIDFGEDLRVDNLDRFRVLLEEEIVGSDEKVICNFKMVSHLNSQCLGMLTGTVRKLRKQGKELKLSNLSEKIKGLFKIIHLDKMIEIYDSEDAAIKSFKDE